MAWKEFARRIVITILKARGRVAGFRVDLERPRLRKNKCIVSCLVFICLAMFQTDIAAYVCIHVLPLCLCALVDRWMDIDERIDRYTWRYQCSGKPIVLYVTGYFVYGASHATLPAARLAHAESLCAYLR